MFNSTMYQQQMVIQIAENQLRNHCPMKEHTDNSVNYMKKDIPQNIYMQGAHHHYPPNNKPNMKKQNQWTNGYNNIRLLSNMGHGLSQSHETLCARPASHDSQTDSSTEDLNDLANKGVKRLHELNGGPPLYVHSYTLHNPTYQQGYQPHHKRRHNLHKFGSPPHVRRNKHPVNSGNIYDLVPDRYLARSQLQQVRVTPKQLISGSQWDQLSTDVWNKFVTNQQTSENYINKINLFKQLYTNIKKHLRYSVFVVGSTFNGFGSNTSDLDLCLVVRNQTMSPDGRTDAMHHLINVHQLIIELNRREKEFSNLALIDAKVPLLKIQNYLGVDVDINCNNCVGIRNTHLLHCYSKADWRVQPLVLVVKLWAQTHQINDAKNMTISSYSLALMVIHFLQCGTQPAVLPCLQEMFPVKFDPDQGIHTINVQETLELAPTTNTQSLGELLLQFFHYYNNFNYAENALSVREGRTLPIDQCRIHRSPKNDHRAWSYLCIEEPFDHTNTARAVYDEEKFKYILSVFRASYLALKESRSLDSIFHHRVAT